jgi:hypothetical protein
LGSNSHHVEVTRDIRWRQSFICGGGDIFGVSNKKEDPLGVDARIAQKLACG